MPQTLNRIPMSRAWTTTFGALLCLLATGCDPKPIAQLPNLSGEKPQNTTDRDLPGGKTLAAALTLLDPRISNPLDLAKRREAFEQKLASLVPTKDDRERMGFSRVIRWHRLYTRRLTEHSRALSAYERRLTSFLRPKKGTFVEIDDHSAARVCKRKATHMAPPVVKLPKGAEPPAKDERQCKPVAGFPQLEYELSALRQKVRAVVEAQWFLLSHLHRLRSQLDPSMIGGDLPEPSEETSGIRAVTP